MEICMVLNYMRRNKINGEIISICRDGFEYKDENGNFIFVPF